MKDDAGVSQASREAAALATPMTNLRMDMRKGLRDDHPAVQAFHRFEQTIRSEYERDAEIAEAAHGVARGDVGHFVFGLCDPANWDGEPISIVRTSSLEAIRADEREKALDEAAAVAYNFGGHLHILALKTKGQGDAD